MTAIDDFSDDDFGLIEHPGRRAFLGLALPAAGRIFRNRIDPQKFPQTSVTSVKDKCDTAFVVTGGKRYPGTSEVFPNCFHASNTTNLHFHGTHVTPGTFGDNVLIGVLPNPKMDVA